MLTVVALVMATAAGAPVVHPEVVSTRPHDPSAFTQGLLLYDGALYESTGLYGHSSLRKVDPKTGQVLQEKDLSAAYFGEGLARVGSKLFQLTWKKQTVFAYDVHTFDSLGQGSYSGEGWGLCYDGTHLVMSNGTSELAFRDPATFQVVRQVKVTLDGRPRDQLNELACVNGVVYANVWQTNEIVRIDPSSGHITEVIDASGLLSPSEAADADVLNGIAYDAASKTFLITGKLWPKLFEVRFPDPTDGGDSPAGTHHGCAGAVVLWPFGLLGGLGLRRRRSLTGPTSGCR